MFAYVRACVFAASMLVCACVYPKQTVQGREKVAGSREAKPETEETFYLTNSTSKSINPDTDHAREHTHVV